MNKRNFIYRKALLLAIASVGFVLTTAVSAVAEQTELPKWTVWAGGGYAFLEKDEPQLGGQLYETRIGYSTSTSWTFEGTLGVYPFLEGRDFDNRTFSNGLTTPGESWGLTTGIDALYHFNKDPERKWDPFLIMGGGINWWNKDIDGHFAPYGELGLGLTRQLSDSWALRFDARTALVGKNTEFNEHLMAYLGYRWGGKSKQTVAEGEGLFDNEAGLKRLQTIYFDFDQSVLSEEAQQKLQHNAEMLKSEEHVDGKIVVEGHCDERGTQEYNAALGERRAQSAYDYYRSLGVPAEKLSTVSYGEDNPVDPASNEEAWAKNRRVETVVAPE